MIDGGDGRVMASEGGERRTEMAGEGGQDEEGSCFIIFQSFKDYLLKRKFSGI